MGWLSDDVAPRQARSAPPSTGSKSDKESWTTPAWSARANRSWIEDLGWSFSSDVSSRSLTQMKKHEETHALHCITMHYYHYLCCSQLTSPQLHPATSSRLRMLHMLVLFQSSAVGSNIRLTGFIYSLYIVHLLWCAILTHLGHYMFIHFLIGSPHISISSVIFCRFL